MSRNPEDDGLARIGTAYFMVRSPTGGTHSLHAINPKTKKTYCGHDMLKLWDKWRPIDKLPDDVNQPTCKICQRHFLCLQRLDADQGPVFAGRKALRHVKESHPNAFGLVAIILKE